MPTRIDGNNGVLQSYDLQVPTTGFSYTFPLGTTTLIVNPAGTLATGTITMPAAPTDGMVVTIESTRQVTAVTVAANAGQLIVGAASQLIPNQPLSFIYRQSDTTWYPIAGGAGRATAIASGTSVTASGTSVDFTGIPSWVKRITVMFQGVSTNATGSSPIQIQIGSGSVTTSGYACAVWRSGGTATFSSGFVIVSSLAAATTVSGTCVINLLGSNTYVETSFLARTDSADGFSGGGSITLGGTLDRVRVTTVNGTDAFDAGSINILYE